MKIQVAQQDLETAISTVRFAVGKDADLSSHYLFRLSGGVLKVNSFSRQTFASAPIISKVDNAEDGDAFTVEAWRLEKWVAAVGEGLLTLEYEGNGDVRCKGPHSRIRLRSLDPTKWPTNDNLMASAEEMGTIDGAALNRALALCKFFMSDEDTTKPEIAQVESRAGVLWASDRRSILKIDLPLTGLDIRIPSSDVNTVSRFLGGKDSITIKNSDRDLSVGGGGSTTFWKSDGSYFGVSRPVLEFPDLKIPSDQNPPVQLTLDREEFAVALSVLLAGAPKGHSDVTFSYNSGQVYASMPCEAGGLDEYPLEKSVLAGDMDNWTDFTIRTRYLEGVASTFGLDTLSLGVYKKARGGYVEFRVNAPEGEDGEELFGNKFPDDNRYTAIILWKN